MANSHINPKCVTIFRNAFTANEVIPTDLTQQRRKLERILVEAMLPMNYKWAFVHGPHFVVVWHNEDIAKQVSETADVDILNRGSTPAELNVMIQKSGGTGFAGSVGPSTPPPPPTSRQATERSWSRQEGRVDSGYHHQAPPHSTTYHHHHHHHQQQQQQQPSQQGRPTPGRFGQARIPPSLPHHNAGGAPLFNRPSGQRNHPSTNGASPQLQTTLFELRLNPKAQLYQHEFMSKGDRGNWRPSTEMILNTLVKTLIGSEDRLPQPCVKGSSVYHWKPLPMNIGDLRKVTTKSEVCFDVRLTGRKAIELDPRKVTPETLEETEQTLNHVVQDQIEQVYHRLGDSFLRSNSTDPVMPPPQGADLNLKRHKPKPKPINTEDGCEVYATLHSEVVLKIVKDSPIWTVNLNPARRVFTSQSVDELVKSQSETNVRRFIEDELKHHEVITLYNPQLYLLQDVCLGQTASDRLSSDPNDRLSRHTGESYLVENYGYTPGTLGNSYMISARQVKGRFHDPVLLVASECRLSVGREHKRYSQLCDIEINSRMGECRAIAAELHAILSQSKHLLRQLGGYGDQIVVPFIRLSEPTLKIQTTFQEEADIFRPYGQWGSKTASVSLNSRLNRIWCVHDDHEGKGQLLKVILPDLRRKLQNAKCTGFNNTQLICKQDFLHLREPDGMPRRRGEKDEEKLHPSDIVFHLVNNSTPGSYQEVKAKCDRVGASSQSMSQEKFADIQASGERKNVSAYTANLMKQLVMKHSARLPWTLQMNEKFPGLNCVIVLGIDAYHSKKHFTRGVDDSDPSVVALVAWLMLRNPTDGSLEWKHTCDYHYLDTRYEILTPDRNLLGEFCANVQQKWADDIKAHGLDGVIVYRDGVGRSQFEAVAKNELPQVEQAFSGPKNLVTYIIVQKRIQFACGIAGARGGDAPQGALIEGLKDMSSYGDYSTYYSHPTGTHAPVQHIILQNNLGLDDPSLRELNYQMCFMYPTWADVTKAPFTIQCAHKLSNYIADRLKPAPHPPHLWNDAPLTPPSLHAAINPSSSASNACTPERRSASSSPSVSPPPPLVMGDAVSEETFRRPGLGGGYRNNRNPYGPQQRPPLPQVADKDKLFYM